MLRRFGAADPLLGISKKPPFRQFFDIPCVSSAEIAMRVNGHEYAEASQQAHGRVRAVLTSGSTPTTGSRPVIMPPLTIT